MVEVTLCPVLQNWVTSYSLSYSNDTNIWFYYKDPNLLEAKVLQASSSYVRSALSLSLLSSFCFSYPFVSVIFLSLYFPSFSPSLVFCFSFFSLFGSESSFFILCLLLYISSFFISLRLCLHFSLYLSPAGFLPVLVLSCLSVSLVIFMPFVLLSLFPLSLFSFSLYIFIFCALFLPVFFALFSFFLCSSMDI
jgi:hypothetical protein